MILCRVNAPLVKECLNLIKQGKAAVVRGKDIGESLIKIIKNNDSIDAWYSKAVSQKGITEGKKLLIEDKYATLKYLWKGSKEKTVNAIKNIFSDSNSSNTIVLSTIHKAKGLEAENVYAIRPDLLPHPRSSNLIQEMNLKYVCITRAKESLCFIQ
jgi:superfamily I DNA/RNA helicase